jgi:hypothetical protein
MKTASMMGFLLLVLSASASAAELPAVMVLNIKAEEQASPGLAAILTELVLQGVHDQQQLRVVGQKDVSQMLSLEQQKQLAGCTDTSCIVEIAGALGTKYTIDGTVGIVGSSNVLSLTLLDTSKATVVSRKTAIIKGEREQLLGSVAKLLRELLEPLSLPTGQRKQSTEATVQAESYPMNPYKLWGHVGVWGGLGMLGLGGTFSALNKKAVDDYNTGKNLSTAKDDIGTFRPLAITAYTVGGLLIASGVTLWILSPGDEAWAKKHALSIVPSVDPREVGVCLSGRW